MDLELLQGTGRNGAADSGRVERNESITPETPAPHFETGPEAGNTNHGIYEVVGEEWRFCLNMTGGPAPKEVVAERIMVRGQAPAVPVGTVPVAELQGEWTMLSYVRAGNLPPASLAKQRRRNTSATSSLGRSIERVSEAQRVRRAQSVESGTCSRRTPFCECSSVLGRGGLGLHQDWARQKFERAGGGDSRIARCSR